MKIVDSDVLFEDNHLIAIHKPTGALTQRDKTGDPSIIENLKLYLKTKYNKPGNVYLAPLHRLDRPVQGVLLFAKTSKAAERMNKAFRENSIQKTYMAIVEGELKSNSGSIISNLFKPITGRSHQLRVHCAKELGCPIVGDIKYGSKHKTSNRSLYLLSRSIEFTHPVTKEKTKIVSNTPTNGLWENYFD